MAMNEIRSVRTASAVLAGLLLAAGGCQQQALRLLGEPGPVPQRVPATAVLEPARVDWEDFMHDVQPGGRGQAQAGQSLEWLGKERLDELCRDHLLCAQLFQDVATDRPAGSGGMYLVLRPRLEVRQHVRPSVGGTVLTLGTGLLYNILGGSAYYRCADCDLEVTVAGPSGRVIGTYVSTYHVGERLMTDGADQLGHWVNVAVNETLRDVANKISADTDVLMRALPASKGAWQVCKRPEHLHINVGTAGEVVVRARQTRVTGQVMGLSVPATLEWAANGKPGGTVPLADTDAESTKAFDFQATLPEGIVEVVLTVRGKADEATPAPELARKGFTVLCLPDARAAEKQEIRKRWAVVIGISDYAHDGKAFDDLRFAHRDAEAFYEFLIDPQGGGFSRNRVWRLVNRSATYANVREALFSFLSRAGRDDLVVIFFSCHGMPLPGTEHFFMLCHDTHPDKIASTALPMWDIDVALRRFVRAERVVVLADACHAGVLTSPAGAKSGSGNLSHLYLQRLALAKPGRLVFTASEARELSYEAKEYGGGHGVFTHYLLEGLKGAADGADGSDPDGRGVITVGEIIEYVREKVAEATEGKQHPDPAGNYDRKLPLSAPGRAK
jgi:uncharacterized caspase-like protein